MPSLREGTQHTAVHFARLLGLAGVFALACASPPAPSSTELEAALAGGGAEATAGLRVRLAFGARADLDLYVSDPLAETVYFGNTPSVSGGRLAADLRCVDPDPRVEEVRFESPPTGRYRVGVDYSEACDGGGDAPEPFVLEVVRDGRRELHRGEAPPDYFSAVVLEFEID